MRIEHICPLFSREHGGPPVSIGGLVCGLAARGHQIKLRVLEGFPQTSPAVRLDAIVEQQVFPVAAPKVSARSPKLKSFLRNEPSPQVYHLHGTWHLANKYAADEARRRNVPYVVDIIGSYQPHELSRKPWRKRLFRKWFVDRMLREAACIHTNSPMEMRQLMELGFRGPFAPIPVGFDTVAATVAERQLNGLPAFAAHWKTPRFILYLARLHPDKGVEVLINAWARLARDFPTARLVIAGPGRPDYKDKLIAQSRAVPNAPIDFLNYVSESEKTWLYKNAFVYCLPTSGENFGATIQDALGFGTPVITTRQTPWESIEEKEVGWLAQATVESVEETLRRALSLDDTRRQSIGEKARKWIRNEFSFDKVIDQQIQMYEWLCGAGIPDFIVVP